MEIIPTKKLHCDHLCRVRHCVNPAHIEVVTLQENVLRGVGIPAVNFHKTHCKNGHVFDEVHTQIEKDGHRRCRICRKAKDRQRKLDLNQLPYNHPKRIAKRESGKRQTRLLNSLPFDHPRRVARRAVIRRYQIKRQKNIPS
ncbi:MAG: hypothetical protein M3367_02900 [Acidobacteriota bacterium]|nr:hypothetical protein [Acidobacteriota bacterium]